jgi:hypothetical protein
LGKGKGDIWRAPVFGALKFIFTGHLSNHSSTSEACIPHMHKYIYTYKHRILSNYFSYSDMWWKSANPLIYWGSFFSHNHNAFHYAMYMRQ